nr:pleiotropic drug resistance protein 3-like isoform X3 [Tanacetum cinerariifolium]
AQPPRHKTSPKRDNEKSPFMQEMSNNFKMDDDQKRRSTKDDTTACSYIIDRCSGANKTILLDVLVGRKSSGTVKGEIKIGGYL